MKYLFSTLLLIGFSALAGCGDSSGPQTSAPAVNPPPAQTVGTIASSAAAGEVETVDPTAGEGAATDVAEIDLAAGEATYNRSCLSCHAAGLAGAPKLGVAEDWAPRAAKGLDALVASSLAGVPPAMPAKGLCFDCSEADMRNVVAYMLSKI